MLTSFYCFASDLEDAGAETVLDELHYRAGVGGITLAAAYHAGRDLFPHGRRSHLRYLRGGEVHFRPDPQIWHDVPLRPLGGAHETLGELVTLAAARDLFVDAWTVFLHVDREHDLPPGLAEQTCFGDERRTELCPANPGARAYAVALATEVARRGVRAVIAESLHYHPLGHGYHHERYFVDLSPRVRVLLGLCFCQHCCPDRFLAEQAAALVQAEFDAGGGRPGMPLGHAAAARLLDGQIGALLERRARAVADITAEVADACRAAGSQLVFLDASGAALGYADGRPTGPAAPSVAWQMGVDVGAVAHAADALGVIAYAADPGRVSVDLDAYRRAIGPTVPLEAVLRPVRPDCTTAGNLRSKVATCRARGVRACGFYHYGMAPLVALDRVRVALA